jgi:hypothetical protein
MGISATSHFDDWGFFAHRKINELAVFTLPPEMLHLYKPNINYIEEHAVDPDKRRYASVFEGIRHYIDMDQWESLPIDTLPRDWSKALLQYAQIYTVWEEDTIIYKESAPINWAEQSVISFGDAGKAPLDSLLWLFRDKVLPQYYEEEWKVRTDYFYLKTGIQLKGEYVYFLDKFSEHGVLPYHLERWQYRLTEAFKEKDIPVILRLSAEMGHYIGDAHVPLHTSKNYNGQLTDQVGIHAFWESRIPELFAEQEYDFFVGTAEYQDDKKAFFWNMISESHALVDSVLGIEKRLRRQFPESEQMCFDERLGRTVLTQCKSFAKAYQEEMDGMVEERMRESIQAIGSCWYTAWVDAGQPDLRTGLVKAKTDSLPYDGPPEKEINRIQKRTHNN